MSETPHRAQEPSAFSPVIVLWMVLVGVFSFSAFIVLSTYAPDLRGGSDPGAHALSRSAVGYAGLVRLMQADGETVILSRKINPDRQGTDLLVLTPGPGVSADDVFDRSALGRVLIVAPKWEAAPKPENPGWVDRVGPIEDTNITKLFARRFPGLRLIRHPDVTPAHLSKAATPGIKLNAPLDETAAWTTGPITGLQTLAPSANLIPVLTDARGGAVLATSRDGRVAILSDPDLLNTQGLKSLATARVALGVIDGLSGDSPTIFDLTLNGFNSPPSLLKLAFEPPFLAATLCLVAAAGLMGFHAAVRFAAPRRTPRALAFGKRALADNSAALIRLAKREHRMAGRYLSLTRNAVAKALGATRLSGEALDAFLDRLAEKNGLTHRLSSLNAQAASAKSRADVLRVARALHQWRLEMTHDPR